MESREKVEIWLLLEKMLVLVSITGATEFDKMFGAGQRVSCVRAKGTIWSEERAVATSRVRR
jgi:hypothetical protein